MKVLLIDDEAENGWKEVLERVLFNGSSIQVAVDDSSAKLLLQKTEYDLIILDLRFGEIDHKTVNVSQFGGYKILRAYIRNSFSNKNFSTPVLLFTASNKAWNVFEMIENGVDGFYIKEHPDSAFDLEFSRENYKRLKNAIPTLINTGSKRREIWNKIQLIINYSRLTVEHPNIKIRVEEKLKIGYGLLFRHTSQFENEQLLFNNEINAFIVFWSILEEIAKDSFKDDWIKSGVDEGKMNDNKWILKNGKIFIEDFRIENFGQMTGGIKVGIKWNIDKYVVDERMLNFDDREVNFYTGKINLSLQIYAILLLGKGWSPKKTLNTFKPLNEFRNEIDFIHSSLNSIFSKRLSAEQNSRVAYNKCNEILDFLDEVLKT